jgi:nucleoside-diphosphate-sugar epimerase
MQKMKIVVTGSSGLLGRHVAAAAVDAGHTTLGIDEVAPVAATWAHVTADLTNLGASLQLIRDCDAVIHIAAIPRPTGRAGGEVFMTNVAATYNVVEAAAMAGAKRFVYASSMSVFGYPFFEAEVRPPYLPVDQGHPICAQDPYGLSKWLGEEIVDAAVRRRAFSAVSVRMPWIQTPETFYRDVGYRRTTADSARDLWGYLDARDAAQGFMLALDWQGEGHLRTLLSAADTFMEEASEPLVRKAFPQAAFSRPIGGCDGVLDISHAQTTLGFRPVYSWRSYQKPEMTP